MEAACRAGSGELRGQLGLESPGESSTQGSICVGSQARSMHRSLCVVSRDPQQEQELSLQKMQRGMGVEQHAQVPVCGQPSPAALAGGF